jgi:hypothetical protein
MSVDIAVTAENPERASGVWVVNIETGKIVAFLRFSGMVEELYAVHLMRGTARPHVSAENSPALETTWVLPEAARPEVELAAAAMPSYRAS